MGTTVWHGHLTFGLVSIPVRLFKAARSEKIRFHQLVKRPDKAPPAKVEPPQSREGRSLEAVPPTRGRVAEIGPATPVETYTRVRQNAVIPPQPSTQSAGDDRPTPIPRADLVKGFEYEKDRYVVVESEDLKKITPQTTTEMEIVEFVKLEEIDPVYFETSYYVAPDEAGEKAYALLFQAMRETQFVAVAEVAMHRREHVVVLRPGKHGLLAHTMFYTAEIRQDQEYRTDPGAVAERELTMAKLLVQSLAAPFEPGKYKDKFREKLQSVINAKLEGRQVAQIAPAREPAEVVDILQALEKSLNMVRKPAGKTESPVPAGAASRKAKRGAAR